MASTRATAAAEIDDTTLDALIAPDAQEFGRRHVRLAETGTPILPVLIALRRANGDVTRGDVAEVAAEWHVKEDAVRAAVRYYRRHRDLFDAVFLLQDEEWNAVNDGR